MKIFTSKKYLSRYFFHLQNKVDEYKTLYPKNPKKAIWSLIVWNFKQSLKIYNEEHANDYWEPYRAVNNKRFLAKRILFPYEQIKKDSIVVIWGANDYTRELIQQNNNTKYCRIISIVDDLGTFSEHDIEGVSIGTILPPIESFDYLIVANIDRANDETILNELIRLNCPLSKVIFNLREADIEEKSVIDSRVRICAIITGGLGDYIIEKKAIMEIQKLDTNSVFFLTTEDLRKKDFLDTVFFDMQGVYLTYENEKDIKQTEYDLVFRLDHIIHILYADVCSLRKKSESIYKFVDEWITNYDYIKEYNSRIPYESIIHVNRARLTKKDRYSIMASYTSLNIDGHDVPIGLKENYRRYYEQLNLPSVYITMNFGADARPDGLMQVKTWPVENYNALIELIKKDYPSIKIVQIGNRNTFKFAGVDVYAFDNNIETVKYILKNSSLHIDCEGGLVHLATQLGTKCAVLFGPTPAFYYGYEENINVLPRVCGECMGVIEEWYTHCILDDSYPAKCMLSLSPDYVKNRINKVLKEIEDL